MTSRRWSRTRRHAIVAALQCLVGLLWYGVSAASAQQLPVRRYDVSDGLSNNWVTSIYQDRKGYLWFTGDQLVRFDGYHFTTYHTHNDLGASKSAIAVPNRWLPRITAITEDRQGRLWVGTAGLGLARLMDDPRESTYEHRSSDLTKSNPFVAYSISDTVFSNTVLAILFDEQDHVWCMTDAGLYRAPLHSVTPPQFDAIVSRPMPGLLSSAALADRQGHLWFGMEDQLIQIIRNRVIKYGSADEIGSDHIVSLIEDPSGKVLAANRRAMFEFMPAADAEARGQWRQWPLSLEPDQEIRSLMVDSTGQLWIGTTNGLLRVSKDRSTVYTTANGLSSNSILALTEDREANLWIGTGGSGVNKLPQEMIVSFTKSDGLVDPYIMAIIEDQQGRLYASTRAGGVVEVVGERIVPIPGSARDPFDRIESRVVQDRRGNWWVGTDEGLFRFPAPHLQFRHGKKVPSLEGAPKPMITGIHEDATGRLWIGLPGNRLYWFDPERNAHPTFESVETDSCSSDDQVMKMVNERSGTLWLGWRRCLARWMKGRLQFLAPTDGLPETWPRAFYQDTRDWFWIGLRNRGVSMTKDPTAEHPMFVNYSTQEGLVGNDVWAITEDEFGRIYLGTGKGLDRLDPATGQIRHFSTADGLASNLVYACLRDRQGYIWVGTTAGLSRINPRAERVSAEPPPIYLSRVQVAGEDQPLPVRGAQQVPELKLSASQNNLRIEYVGLSFQGEGALSYQYKLEGVDQDWNPPSQERSVNFARLAPGSYRFLVQALTRDGAASAEPAAFYFHILPPIWQRWWFAALVVATFAALAYALHRFRLRQVVAMERIRQQIATDLHDDVGSGLSQVAILSEVAKRETSPAGAEMLTEVADLARAMRDSMSDIVWAVDPRKDRLADLAHRMRQVTFNLLEADGRRVEFLAPDEPQMERIGLPPDRRRHLLLIFKEAITNIVQHTQAEQVRIKIQLDAHRLKLTIHDNGCGFDPHSEYEGHGLHSLKQRAAALKADLQIQSTPTRGTIIQVTVPLKTRLTADGHR